MRKASWPASEGETRCSTAFATASATRPLLLTRLRIVLPSRRANTLPPSPSPHTPSHASQEKLMGNDRSGQTLGGKLTVTFSRDNIFSL